MKKLIAISLVLICLCAVFSGCDMSIYTDALSTVGDDVKYTIKENRAIVVEVANKASVEEIVIPDEYEGIPVTEIADFAVSNLRFAKKITIGKNVEKMGEWSLRNNEEVTEINVSEDNEYFQSVNGVLFTEDMKTVVAYPSGRKGDYVLPDTTEKISTKAFYKCTGLTGIDIPDSVKTIEEKAFFRCSLEAIELPKNIEVIEKDAFAYCSAVKELVIPGSIKEIGDYAFYSCTSMLSITSEAKQADVKLGEKWYPTNNGVELGELKITWAE